MYKIFFFLLTAFIIFSSGDFLMAQDTQLDDGLYARIVTDKGDILLTLHYQKVPLTVINFVSLAEGTKALGGTDKPTGTPFYDGLKFHRVIKDFMIQGGNLNFKTIKNAPKVENRDRIPFEFTPEHIHVKGALAAARTNNPKKESSFSQFYIVTGKKYNEKQIERIG